MTKAKEKESQLEVDIAEEETVIEEPQPEKEADINAILEIYKNAKRKLLEK
jgi:hypothetical protein